MSFRIRSRGFTLVELMLTILLVGVLAAVATPFYLGYRERTRTVAAVNEVASMSSAISTYWEMNRAWPASLADVGLDNRRDPWGHPYRYYNIADNGKGGARKDHALNPLNTDFDLYSMGPDGATKSQITQKDSLDDILRASNGAFVGVAADF
jgi:general secretion pathway protein G